MASLDYYCEDCEVCGIHSGNARCLGQGFWTVTLEFFTALETNGCAFVIVQPGGDADALVAFRVGGRPFLLSDVTHVVASYPQLFEHKAAQHGIEGRNEVGGRRE